MKEFWSEFFKFLREILPTAVGAFLLGRHVEKIGEEEIRAKMSGLKLELERAKNAQAVEDENIGKSDSDIIDDAVRAGLSKRDH